MRYNNTHINILVSYAYCGNSKAFTDYIVNDSRTGDINYMLDSGAFTLFNAKDKRDWLTLDNYSSYLEKYGNEFEKYVMLDVIGNDDKSKENYETMINRGLNPMFVLTMADDDTNYIKEAVKNNINVCVAGGVTTKGDWIKKRFQDTYKNTKARIHALGFVKYPDMYQLPIASVDSSSWIQSSQVYGVLNYFNNGIKGTRWLDILQRKEKMSNELKKVLESVEVTPKMFSDKDNHKGATSIATLLNTLAFIEYQKYSKRNGIDLFLAANNVLQLKYIRWLVENNNKVTYKKWKKYRKELSSKLK